MVTSVSPARTGAVERSIVSTTHPPESNMAGPATPRTQAIPIGSVPVGPVEERIRVPALRVRTFPWLEPGPFEQHGSVDVRRGHAGTVPVSESAHNTR
jgi:hypothetical protein